MWPYVLIIAAQIALWCVAAFATVRAGGWRRAIPLMLMVIPELACLAWGEVFGVEPGSSARFRSEWLTGAPALMALTSIPAAIAAIVFAKGARLLVTASACVQVVMTFFAVLLVIMQVTGSWI
jgi:hypothetical protein